MALNISFPFRSYMFNISLSLFLFICSVNIFTRILLFSYSCLLRLPCRCELFSNYCFKVYIRFVNFFFFSSTLSSYISVPILVSGLYPIFYNYSSGDTVFLYRRKGSLGVLGSLAYFSSSLINTYS